MSGGIARNTLLDLFKTARNRASLRPFIAPAPSLSSPHDHLKNHGEILIRDEKTVKAKLQKIGTHGPNHFQIMTDFD